MPSSIISRPIKGGCNFNAVGNPIVYSIQREDYQYNQINDNGGDAQIQINGTDYTTYFEVDDTVYIEGIGSVVVTASAFSGGNTLITVDFPYSATDIGYINNLSKRTDYKIEVEVYDAVTSEILGPRIVISPNQAGLAKVNISGMVKSYLSPELNFPVLNEAEEETSKQVYINFEEFYDQTYLGETSDSANPIVCVFAVMHILQTPPNNFYRYGHGGNMLSYFPGDNDQEWLLTFDPTIWRGMPFTISFIWPEAFDNISLRVVQYDSTGIELDDTITELTADVEKIHRTIVPNLHDDASSLIVTLVEPASGEDNVITKELNVKVKDPCENPVFLFWKNPRGGDTFWMFDESQNYDYTYPNGRVVKRLILFADNLNIHEWDGINQLNSDSQVIAKNIVDYGMDDSVDKTHFRNDNQVYIVNDDGSKLGVIVVPTGNQTRTFQKKHSIEITIELPEFFTV